MHFVFKIDELVKMIVENMAFDDEKEDFPERSIAYFARTCKAMYPTASARLWRNLRDLVPLIRCFPSDSWIIRDNDQGSVLYFTRPLRAKDWSTFLKCAARVQSLGHHWAYPTEPDPGTWPDLNSSVLSSISLYRPIISLFPNLRALYDPFGFIPHAGGMYVILLLGPKLKTLNIKQNTLESSIHHIPILCPHLVELKLSLHPEYNPESLASLLCNLHSLESFICSGAPLRMSALTSLGSLTRLHSLAINLEMIPPYGLSFTSLLPFKALRHLTISISKFTCIIQLLESTMLRLKSFNLVPRHLSGHKQPSDKDIRIFFSVFRTHVAGPDLQELSIGYSNWRMVQDDAEVTAVDAARISSSMAAGIQSLPLSFKNLTSLCVNLPWLFKLDDTILEELALGWPHLSTLELGIGEPFNVKREMGISLYGLIPLVRHCPKLEKLVITLHADGSGGHKGGVPRRPSAGCVNTNLKKITFGNSRIFWPADVAAFLSDLFPNLQAVNEFWYSGEHPPLDRNEQIHDARWREVNRLLPTFARVREEERAWKGEQPRTQRIRAAAY